MAKIIFVSRGTAPSASVPLVAANLSKATGISIVSGLMKVKNWNGQDYFWTIVKVFSSLVMPWALKAKWYFWIQALDDYLVQVTSNSDRFFLSSCTVRPDVGVKSSPIFSKSCPKGSTAVLRKKYHFSKWPKSFAKYLAIFVTRFAPTTFKNRPIWSHLSFTTSFFIPSKMT